MPSRAALATIDVMIVDDNLAMRSLLRSVLRAAGLSQVRDASDGYEALDLLALRPADLVLLDYAMPGLNGLDVVQKLRNHPDPRVSRGRIVMISGYGDRRHVAAARDAGVDEFLVKPITTRALLQRIEAALRHCRAFVDAETFHGPDRRRRDRGAPGEDRRVADIEVI